MGQTSNGMKDSTLHRLVIIMLMLVTGISFYNHVQAATEDDYNRAWCSKHYGQPEVILSDRSRVDCLTETHAVEADWAGKSLKPYECVGQALHYAEMTGKQPGCLLIIREESDCRFYKRIRKLSYNNIPRITLWQTGEYVCPDSP